MEIFCAGAAPDQCPHGVPYRWNCETCDAAPAQEADKIVDGYILEAP